MADEEQIRASMAAGDLRAAATEVIRLYGPAVLRYLRSLLRSEADASDAFSEWAETLWKGLGGFRGEASVRTWSYRIAWTCARNVRDEAWKKRGRPLATGEASQLADQVRTNSKLVEEQKRQALDELREALPQEEQSLLVLRIDQQLSWNEIALVMAEHGDDVEAATLMKRFERLKVRLAKMAKERGLLK